MHSARAHPTRYDQGVPVATDPRLKNGKRPTPTGPKNVPQPPTPPNTAISHTPPGANISTKRTAPPSPDIELPQVSKKPRSNDVPLAHATRRPSALESPLNITPTTATSRLVVETTPTLSPMTIPRAVTKSAAVKSPVIRAPENTPTYVDSEIVKTPHGTPQDLAAQLAKLVPILAKAPSPAAQVETDRVVLTPALPPAWQSIGADRSDFVSIGTNDLDTPSDLSPEFVNADHFDQSPTKEVESRNTTSIDATTSHKDLLVVPPIPLEAIETLQVVTGDIIKLLADKSRRTRERDLLVAVGTMRAVLEVEFEPHTDTWKTQQIASTEETAFEPPKAIQPSNAIVESIPPRLCIVVPPRAAVVDSPLSMSPKKPESTTPFGIASTREALKSQLAGARHKMDRLESEIKDKGEENDGLKDTIKRLTAQLIEAQSKSQSTTQTPLSASAQRKYENIQMGRLQRQVRVGLDKIASQRTSITGLLASCASLKDQLREAGTETPDGSRLETPTLNQGPTQSACSTPIDKNTPAETRWQDKWNEHLPSVCASLPKRPSRLPESESSEAGSHSTRTSNSSHTPNASRSYSTGGIGYNGARSRHRRNGSNRDPRSDWEREFDRRF